MTRLVLVQCPALEHDDEGGDHLRRFARVVEALSAVCPWIDPVRPGVCTLPIRAPLRYFGDEEAVLARVREVVVGAERDGHAVRLGVAEGVFAAALAAQAQVVVPEGGVARFLAPWPVTVLGQPDLADLLARLGLPTLGDFAALPPADVEARLGAAGGRAHRLARGLDGEPEAYRQPGLAGRLVAAVGRDLALTEHQPGFWGGTSAADERAAEVLTALQRRLGPEAVTVAVVGGGRGASDRCRLVVWRPCAAAAISGPPATPGAAPATPGAAPGDPGSLPWPGQLPPPAPAQLAETPVEVVDAAGAPVGVTGRGLLTGRPTRLSIGGGPWAAIEGWSAPWPVEERWWSRGRRRAARLQVVTVDGRAYLAVVERGRWRLEAAYR